MRHDLPERAQFASLVKLQVADALSRGPTRAGMNLSPVTTHDGSAIYYRRSHLGFDRVEAFGTDGVLRNFSLHVRRVGRIDNQVGTVNAVGTFTLFKQRRRALRLSLILCPIDRVIALTAVSWKPEGSQVRAVASWILDLKNAGASSHVDVQHVFTAEGRTTVDHVSIPPAVRDSVEGHRILVNTFARVFEGFEGDLAEFQSFVLRLKGSTRRPRARDDKDRSPGSYKKALKALLDAFGQVLETLLGDLAGQFAGEAAKAAVVGLFAALFSILGDLIDKLPDPASSPDPAPPDTPPPDPDTDNWDDPAPSWGDGTIPAAGDGGGSKGGEDEPGSHEKED